jgi:uncharacterized protein (DUF2062 family)
MTRFPRVRGWLEQLLHTHDTPSRTAVAYALGVFFGFSPLLGLHTVLALSLAFAFRLNRIAVLLGVYSNLPWILVPYYSLATWLGAALLRVDIPPGALEGIVTSLENRSWREFQAAALGLRPFLRAFTLGSTLGAILLALAAYRVAFVMICKHRQRTTPPHAPEIPANPHIPPPGI